MTDQSDGPATPPSPRPAEPEDGSPADELTEAVAEGVAEAVTEALGPEAAAEALSDEPAAVPTADATATATGEPATAGPAETPAPAEPAEVAVDTPAPAEPAEVAVEPAPAEPAEVAVEPAPEEFPPAEPAPAEPVTAAGERLEWRPVATGDQIEWQPVSVPDDEPVQTEEAWDEAAADDDFDPDAGWDQPTAGAAAAMAGNGATRPRTRPARPRPASGRPGPRPPAGRRPPTRAAGARPGARRPPAAGHAGDGGDEANSDDRPGAGAKAKRQVVILSVLTAVVLLVAVVGFVLSRGATKTGSEATATSVTPSSRPAGGTTVPPADLITFRDDQTGFTIKYPKSWNRLSAPVADIRTVLLPGAGNANAVSVRVIPISTPADQQNIGNFKAVTDTIAFGDQRNRLIQEQLVTLNGKLTYYYIYTFKDEATNQEGVHAHYFVFEGLRMFSMVFQALPAEEFNRLAAVYDQVAESFTVEPVRTTIAPTTSAPAASAPAASAPPTTVA